MAKTFNLRIKPTSALLRAKIDLLKQTQVPPDFLRASYVRQFLTCGKSNCRCRRGFKHGPFFYLVQCLRDGRIQKFLLKTAEQRRNARAGITAQSQYQEQLEKLSEINTELARRNVSLRTGED
jgi:hypothetical protein